MRINTKQEQADQFPTDAGTEWAEWPDAEVEVDDDEFAAAIARGRELEAAA